MSGLKLRSGSKRILDGPVTCILFTYGGNVTIYRVATQFIHDHRKLFVSI